LGKPCIYNSQCPAGLEGLVLFCRDGRCDYGCFEERDCPAFYTCTTGNDPAVPGNCELIGPRGQLYCDPDQPQLDPQQGACACQSPAVPTGPQICKPDGSGYEACPCNG
jgi:hypothetical protein